MSFLSAFFPSGPGHGMSVPLPSDQSTQQQRTDSECSEITHGCSKFLPLLSLVDSAKTNGEDDDNTLELRDKLNTWQAATFMNTPIFSSGIDSFVQSKQGPGVPPLIPQYGLIGIQVDAPDIPAKDKLVLANMNVPWSAFICGSQGAGKSHTLSCLLESYIDQNSGTGKLLNPLAGLVMHYDNFTNNTTTQLCEAAYLCSSGIPVNVLVCPSHIWTMKRLYTNLPGIDSKSLRPRVMPLYLTESQLNISRILKLMAVDPTISNMPLYMEVVMNITRQMAMEGPTFTYTEFRRRLEEVQWVKGQDGPLNMRLQMLDTFLAPSPLTKTTKPAQADEDIWAFAPGSLTIVDLSDPFLSSDDACALFSICLSIFLEDRGTCGRVVALDEAHKFLVQSGEARILTGELTSIIRQQRHTGTRVIIATQEPTLAPELIDLANVTFVHRFLSPAWYKTLEDHLAAASHPGRKSTLFETIVTLKTGEAILFCPTALLSMVSFGQGPGKLKALGNQYIRLTIRKRTTVDGGKSITATDISLPANPQSVEEVPMYVVNRTPIRGNQDSTLKKYTTNFNEGKVTTMLKKPIAPDTKPAAPDTKPAAPDSSIFGKTLATNVSKKQVKKAAAAQVKEKAKKGWGPITELTLSQKNQLYSEAESYLEVVSGTVAKSTWLREAFDKHYSCCETQHRV
ncbi:hypothetical protein PGQ11_003138 [Apiospora arundinis]|uniref:Zona occludens toxin N-terminal domain-containing protein n=1 Tax=Apiospora arundinis TaxID=335852 RepID=A0ABR2J4P6_9PEZI